MLLLNVSGVNVSALCKTGALGGMMESAAQLHAAVETAAAESRAAGGETPDLAELFCAVACGALSPTAIHRRLLASLISPILHQHGIAFDIFEKRCADAHREVSNSRASQESTAYTGLYPLLYNRGGGSYHWDAPALLEVLAQCAGTTSSDPVACALAAAILAALRAYPFRSEEPVVFRGATKSPLGHLREIFGGTVAKST
jgi:hypothetical protein